MGWLTRVYQLLFGWLSTSSTNESLEETARSPHYQTLALYWSTAERFMEAGEYDRAADLLERAVRLDPKQTELHNALGQCLVRLGRREDAAVSFRHAAAAASSKGQQAWAKELHDTADWLTPVSSGSHDSAPQARPTSSVAGVPLLDSEPPAPVIPLSTASKNGQRPAEIDLTGGSPAMALAEGAAIDDDDDEWPDIDRPADTRPAPIRRASVPARQSTEAGPLLTFGPSTESDTQVMAPDFFVLSTSGIVRSFDGPDVIELDDDDDDVEAIDSTKVEQIWLDQIKRTASDD